MATHPILLARSERVSVPLQTGNGTFAPVTYGDPFGSGWSTARVVSIIVPLVLFVSVLGYFAYLWIARRDLVKSERARIDRRWNGSGGTVVRRKGAKAVPLADNDDDDLYQPGWRPKTAYEGDSASMPQTPSQSQHFAGSSDSHTINHSSPEQAYYADSPARPGIDRLGTEASSYTIKSDGQDMAQYGDRAVSRR